MQYAPHFKAVKLIAARPYCLRQKCNPQNLVSGNTRLVVIFAEITENKCINKRPPLPSVRRFDQSCSVLDKQAMACDTIATCRAAEQGEWVINSPDAISYKTMSNIRT